MIGDFEVAEEMPCANLIELATRVNAPFWMTAGQLLRGKLLVERREFAEGFGRVARSVRKSAARPGGGCLIPSLTGLSLSRFPPASGGSTRLAMPWPVRSRVPADPRTTMVCP